LKYTKQTCGKYAPQLSFRLKWITVFVGAKDVLQKLDEGTGDAFVYVNARAGLKKVTTPFRPKRRLFVRYKFGLRCSKSISQQLSRPSQGPHLGKRGEEICRLAQV
jgi:hypothetical protein